MRERVYHADEKMVEKLVIKAGVFGKFERIIRD